ncbi:unnamed protein product [Caenorhabditis auriculariae]|uniref:G-protein coupled receptors family 1 profile domain-containing protein n=1 Tax=Caenorhabditis auriculariae TaxID=2777116 RepID=A0A8S1HVR2_9PELO|nr:unnamed protein product [Caenorhabditis auriculariae]
MTSGECTIAYVNENITEYVHAALGNRCQSLSIVFPTVFIYVSIFVLGIVGNISTCIVIIANKAMHNPTNYYLFSLAISDILVLILGLPMELYQAMDFAYPYTFGVAICKARAFLVEFTSYASILIICCFSVERWLAICYPLRVKLFSTLSRANVLIVAAWSISFVAALPMAFIVRINRLPLPPFAQGQSWTSQVSTDELTVAGTDFCAMDQNQPEQQRSLIYFAFITFFMIPALLITVIYGHIAVKLHKVDTQLLIDKNSKSERRSRATRNVFKMLVSVVVSFFLCWLPFHMQRLISVFVMSSGSQAADSQAVQFVSMLVFYISGYCYYSNSACNPILYNILSQNYRKAFCRTILGERLTKRIFPSFSRNRGVLKSNQECSSHMTGHKGSISATRPTNFEIWPLAKDCKVSEPEKSPQFL